MEICHVAAGDTSKWRRLYDAATGLVFAGIIVLFAACSASAAPNLTVNGALKYQTIDGLGTNINVNNWENGQLKPALDFLITTNGSSLFRVVRDPIDWVASESLIPPLHALTPSALQQVYETDKMGDIWNTIAYLNEKGIGGSQIILDFMGWTPVWLGGSGQYGVASHMTAGKEQAFATMVASLVYYGKKVKGLDFTYVSPLNEQDQSACLESPCVDAVQYTTVMHLLADELDYMGLGDVRFVVPDTGANISTSVNYIAQAMRDSTVAARTDHFSIHDYSGSPVAPGTTYSGKDYWVTETSAWCTGCDAGGSGPANEWSFSKQTADVILGDLKNGFTAVLTWEGYDSFWYHHNASSLWGLLAYTPGTGIYTPRKRAYAYAHFNRFIGPGDVVIGASETMSSVPAVVAVYNVASGKVTIVGRNSGSSTLTVNGQLNNLPAVTTLALYETGASANLVRRTDIAVSAGTFTARISADSLFTLTNQPMTSLDLEPPTVAITYPLDGAQVSGTIETAATASDNTMVAGVQFVLDGAVTGQETTTSPYAMSLDTATLANGEHFISAIARDPAGNKTVSQQVSFAVSNGGTPSPLIALIQKASSTTASAQNLSATLRSVTSGNLIVVSVSGWPNVPAVPAVTDSRGNSYSIAGSVLLTQGAYSAIYYARNVTGGTGDTVVTVNTIKSGGQISMVAAEFAGVDTVAPLDKTAGAVGSGVTPSSGAMTPVMSGELLIGSGTHNGSTTTTAGSGLSMIAIPTEDSAYHQPLAMAYRVLNSTDSAAATFYLASGYPWTQNGVLFKPAVPLVPDTTAPSVPVNLTATPVSASQMYVSWTASTDPAVSGEVSSGVAGYRLYRDGSGTPLTSTTATYYTDSGLSPATAYSYTVSAYDGAGNSSAASPPVSATTLAPDTTAPTVSIDPLSGIVSGTITVSAKASDYTGVTKVEFYLDDALKTTDSAPLYTWTWDTTQTTNGSHKLTAMAYDAAGNRGTSSDVYVTVTNLAASIALVQSAYRTTTSAQTLAAALSSKAVTAGNLIVVSVSGWPNLPAATAVTDNLGNTYSSAGTVLTSLGAYSAIYYAGNVKAGAATVTVRTVKSGGQISMVVAEFSGVDTVSPLDKVTGAVGSGTAPSSGTMTPVMTGELVIGSGTHNGNTVTSAGTGFSMIAIPTEDSNTHQPLAMEYQVLSGATVQPVSAAFRLAAGYPWTMNGALFRHK